MGPMKTFTIIPSLPERISRLTEIADNLWWCWDSEAIQLFFRMDRDIWHASYQNPTYMINHISQRRLHELCEDDSFLAHLDEVCEKFDNYKSRKPWFERSCGDRQGCTIAYFSAEFGIEDALSIYSGGLGVLSGDHLKSASDLGLPLVGVGLLYRQGYFKQMLDADGWQVERFPENDFFTMPVNQVKNENGEPVSISVDYPGRKVYANIWRVNMGRNPLYLLDTDIDRNSPSDRHITMQLYSGDRETRIKQEILLGIGGVRALRELGIEPTVIHMNEGHSAFSALERIRLLMSEHGLDYESAREAVTAGNVFTTHTPVPAGNETFSIDLVERYLSLYWKELGLDKRQFMGLGRFNPDDNSESFCMTILAIKLSAYANGVSKLHGEVAREMWSRLWPEVPLNEVPITSITNGIHTRYWISHDMVGLFDRYLGPRWVTHPEDQTIWSRIDQIPDEELWRTHERRRERLVTFTRARLREQLLRRGAPATEVAMADEVLNPEALTIGFARRFAAYKRADLIFRDVERLKKIITKSKKPVQIILAGKAHPADNIGKEIIRKIIQIIAKEDLRRHIVLIENYDMNVSRYMVQGVDIWLNTPRRPNEASGTSGMKATANGAINLSVMDGWWPEAYDGENGWQIGMGQEYEDQTYQNDVESHAIYEVLEKEIIPTYYDRGPDGLPRRWIKRMKAAMRTICPIFNTSRMVRDYAEEFYLPADQRCQILRENGYGKAKELALWNGRVRNEWKKIKINAIQSDACDNMPVGNEFKVNCNVSMGVLLPNEVSVQLYIGPLDMDGKINEAEVVPMIHDGPGEDGTHNFSCKFASKETGRHGYMVRIMPKHVDLGNQFSTGMIVWG